MLCITWGSRLLTPAEFKFINCIEITDTESDIWTELSFPKTT